MGDRKERMERITHLMHVVHLPQDYLARYPHMLSGGQKQRIGIARAIALNSPLIILDEPTSALDVSVQSRVIELLRSIKEQYRITYFFITHDLALVKNFADEVIIMQKGKLVEQGSVDDIFSRPAQSYTRRLLKAIAVVNPEEQAFLDRIPSGEIEP
jgi:ABC-type oligopeptide transport system ATPase subunit